MKCLEKEAGKRFQKAGEVRAALEGLSPGHVASPAISRQKNQTGRRRLRNVILIGTAVVAAVLIALNLIPKHGLTPSVREDRTSLSTGGKNSSIPEANEYFEKGMMFLMHQFDLSRARAMLERSLEMDPKFAEARAWYGFTFLLEIDSGYSNDSNFLYRAEEELQRALQDEPDTARAHSSLAALYFFQGRKDLMIAEAEKALNLNSWDIDAKIWMGNYYMSIGDNTSAEALFNQILEKDPLFFPARMCMGELRRIEGEYGAAIKEHEKILELDPHNSYAIQKISQVYIDMNEPSRARQHLEGLPPSDHPSYDLNLTWALLLAREGRTNEALKKMDDETLKFAALSVWSTSAAAEFYALMGDSEQALDWLERAVRNGDERDDWFRRDPLMESLRGLPRFKKILDSIAFRRQQRSSPLKTS
jgi:tetratricopeptide (TPR) repeat protein